MKASRTLPVVGLAALLSACSPTVYSEQATALKTALGSLTQARQTFVASPARTDAADAARLLSASPLKMGEVANCVQDADAARKAAVRRAGRRESLDPLYAAGGEMHGARACWIGLDKPPAKPAPAAPPASPPAPDEKPALTVAQEIAQDAATCRARHGDPPPKPPKPGDAVRPDEASANLALWAAVDGYVDGLATLTSAEESKRLTDSTAGAAAKLGAVAEKVDPGGPAGAAVTFLFKLIDAAVEQKRHEAVKTSVVCGNALLLEWQGIMKDALRYQQIAAFDRRARNLEEDAKFVRGLYDDPDECATLGADPPVAMLIEKRCEVRLARRNFAPSPAGPSKAADEALAARRLAGSTYLRVRAEGLAPKLTELKATAAAVNGVRTADPGPAVDAFIEAHRALRADILSNKGQLKQLAKRFQDLYEAGDALNKALKPANDEAADEGEAAG